MQNGSKLGRILRTLILLPVKGWEKSGKRCLPHGGRSDLSFIFIFLLGGGEGEVGS